jgi:hypothetical protein
MSGRVTRVRGLLIAAVLVPALAVVAGCGADGSGDGSAPKAAGQGRKAAPGPAAATRRAAAPGRALTAAELKQALLSTSDLPGPLYSRLDGAVPPDAGVSDPDRPACTPLVEQLGSRPHRIPLRAQAAQTIDDYRVKGTMKLASEFLQGYAPGGAQKTMTALHSALKSCTTFTADNGAGGRITMKIKPAPAPAVVGDDAVAYLVFHTGQSTPVALLTVVRTGQQTATYQSFPAFHTAPVLGADIVTAQDKKLRTAAS